MTFGSPFVLSSKKSVFMTSIYDVSTADFSWWGSPLLLEAGGTSMHAHVLTKGRLEKTHHLDGNRLA